ncbi:hypothetical protein LB545_07705 [Mesorhizobium sp. BR1-1-6]|uniref:helix-turn-helix domain-containing protein n=1 Tax=Mesorhizobium sp. BR1-1-6 TaxID=2876648 RepID=UPI001CD10D20|nr:helix-turn-helix domain-containing protein [Mesorhizobium sp. BR1-1-6]MBZ9894228.1 hypothetical protein [Mesorhizobium sp. BR1-1-6]
MYAVSVKNVERNIRVEPSGAERWARILDPVTRHQDAAKEMERQGIAMFRARGTPQWALDIVIACARRRNVALPIIAQDRRFRDAVQARNEAMYLIYSQRRTNPNLSCPRLGKWFGRDHTSVLHGIASHQEANGLTRIVGYNIVSSRKRNANGMSVKRTSAQEER